MASLLRHLDRLLLGGLVLGAIVLVFAAQAGAGARDKELPKIEPMLEAPNLCEEGHGEAQSGLEEAPVAECEAAVSNLAPAYPSLSP